MTRPPHAFAWWISACLAAQAPPAPNWLTATTNAAMEAELRGALGALRPEDVGPYLRTVGSAFFDERPTGTDAPTRRRCIAAHRAIVARVAANEPALVTWFHIAAATWLIAANDCEAALLVLDDAARLVPDAPFAFERHAMRIDCLVALDAPGLADREVPAALRAIVSDEQRIRHLAQRGSIDVALGRLDEAARRLAEATTLLQRTAADAQATAPGPGVEFDLLLRQVDLEVARERTAAARARIAAFGQRLTATGRPLDGEQNTVLRVHELACAYVDRQHDGEDPGATIAEIATLQQAAQLTTRHRELLAAWRADLELRRGRTAEADRILRATPLTRTDGRSQWLRAPIEAEVVRRRTTDDAALAAAEARLHAVILEMVREWREVAGASETTGFLRLGTRLRVVGERIAIAIARGRPEGALDDILEVQRCTTVSRARGAPPLTVAELRQSLRDERSGVLIFVPAWNESHAFALDRDHLVHAALPRASELRSRAARLQTELRALDADTTSPSLDDLRAASHALGDSLLPPSIRAVVATWHTVTITGRSLLGGVPFECIEWERDQLLGERFALTTTGSLPLSVLLQRESSASECPPRLATTLFATLQPEARFAARNDIEAGAVPLATWVARILADAGPGSTQQVGAPATVAAFANTSADSPHCVTVLLAHGEPPIDERPPALGLSPDPEHPEGLLTPDVIVGRPRRGVVFLASCDGARGPTRVGDDDTAATLAGAFLAAGATAVIASSAPLRASLQVDLVATAVTELAAGKSPAEAMRVARLASGAKDRAAAWRAGQVGVFGHGTGPVAAPPPSAPRLAWWLLGGAALLVTGSAARRAVLRSRRAAMAPRRAAAEVEGGCG